jgi:hypothetical protein
LQVGVGGVLRSGEFAASILLCGGGGDDGRFAGAALKAAREFRLSEEFTLRPEATVIGSVSRALGGGFAADGRSTDDSVGRSTGGTLNGLRTTAGFTLRYAPATPTFALTLSARCVLNGGDGGNSSFPNDSALSDSAAGTRGVAAAGPNLAAAGPGPDLPPSKIRLRRLQGEFSAGIAKSFADNLSVSASLSLVHTKLGFSVGVSKRF